MQLILGNITFRAESPTNKIAPAAVDPVDAEIGRADALIEKLVEQYTRALYPVCADPDCADRCDPGEHTESCTFAPYLRRAAIERAKAREASNGK